MRLFTLLLFLLLAFTASAQIDPNPRPAAPKPKPAAPAPAAKASVEVTWRSPQPVKLVIGGKEVMLTHDSPLRMELKPDFHQISAITPVKRYTATSFLAIPGQERGYLSVWIADEGENTLGFSYESETERKERLRVEAERMEALKKAGQATLADMESQMVRIEGGSFTMGCTSEQGIYCDDDEKPAHRVTVGSFYLSKYEVTQALFAEVMGSNPSRFQNCADCPVEQVSWNDAQEFITRLNTLTGKRYRLPTEAEWEYAARGGAQSRGTRYSGSNDIESVGWYRGNGDHRTYPVGGLAANELGLYDMSGNVGEWCSDWYGENYYASIANADPPGGLTGSARVMRGGSLIGGISNCRVADRDQSTPGERRLDFGFRLAGTL